MLFDVVTVIALFAFFVVVVVSASHVVFVSGRGTSRATSLYVCLEGRLELLCLAASSINGVNKRALNDRFFVVCSGTMYNGQMDMQGPSQNNPNFLKDSVGLCMCRRKTQKFDGAPYAQHIVRKIYMGLVIFLFASFALLVCCTQDAPFRQGLVFVSANDTTLVCLNRE